MPKVSVIVPVYNVEKYLGTCIESIINQTLEDIEIICVDDGSTDSSAEILDRYALKDNRIKVIHKTNRGYGHTINTGFDIAVGEYIGIVESDDYILPRMYEVLYICASENDLDLVKSEYIEFWDTINHTWRAHASNMEDYFGKVLLAEDRLLFYRFYMNSWLGIYKRSFLEKNSIRHNETPGASFQDNGFWIQTMSMCSRAMWLNEAFYMYRQDNPLASVKSGDKVWTMYNEYKNVEHILESKGLKRELTICRYYRMVRHQGVFIRIEEKYKEEYAKTIFEDFDRYYEEIKDLDAQLENGILYWINNLRRDGAVSRIIKENMAIKDKLNRCDRAVIYGAAKWAEYICIKLYHAGFYNKVESICVSKKKNIDVLCGRPVLFFKDIENKQNVLFIIGVSHESRAYNEIEKKLVKAGITNFISSDAIYSNFYMV